jgi:hypothetical protein
MQGVEKFREHYGVASVDLWILSAGYGIIPSDQKIVPYDSTFRGMSADEIVAWSKYLQIPQGAREIFCKKLDLLIILLGRDYMKSLALGEDVVFHSPTLFFVSQTSKKYVTGIGRRRDIIVSRSDPQHFACGMIGLKGEIAKRLLQYISRAGTDGIEQLFDPDVDVLELFVGKHEC